MSAKETRKTQVDPALVKYAKNFGFDKVDAKVGSKLVRVSKRLAFNLISNARYVSDACNCKTIRSSHFKAVKQLMGKIQNQARAQQVRKAGQSGGDPVLPQSYFGVPETRYFSDTSAFNETQLNADPTLGRAAHLISDGTMVGGAQKKTPSFVSSAMVEAMIDQYNAKRSNKIKVSKAAAAVMRLSINQNLATVMSHIAGNKVKRLSLSLLNKMIQEHPQFGFMK